MSFRKRVEYTIWDAVTPVAVTSSTDATPIVVTATSHGFATGDLVMIYGHTTNVAANGIFKVTKVNANSFSLQNRFTGANVAGSGAGAGSSGVCIAAPKIIDTTDYTNITFQMTTAGTATTTVLAAGSLGTVKSDEVTGSDVPNFAGTVSKSNPYTLLQIIDLLDNTSKDGGTGVVVAGTDIAKQFEINVNAQKYVTFIPLSWTQGSITLKLIAYSI